VTRVGAFLKMRWATAALEPVADPDRGFEERAAISEYDGGLPREIAEGLANLDTMPPPNGFTPSRWEQTINGAAIFADRWGARALELGWQPIELFGIHPVAPAARHDCLGLAFMLDGGEVVDIDATKATILKPNGIKQSYYRWQASPGAELAWCKLRTLRMKASSLSQPGEFSRQKGFEQ